jgi:large subunit ribosomal protein L5
MSEPSALRQEYQKVSGDLAKEWQKKNRYEVPRLEKIVVNVGMGQAKDDKAYKELVQQSLAQITGQSPVLTQARKSVASFKLREGQDIGAKVTLRGRRMEDFFYRLVHIVLPRVRDFRGLSKKGFDKHGNYSLGLREHTVFPEISVEDTSQVHPLEVTIVTSADSDDEAAEVLKRLGFPFATKQAEAEAEAEEAARLKQQKAEAKAERERKAAEAAPAPEAPEAKEDDGS